MQILKIPSSLSPFRPVQIIIHLNTFILSTTRAMPPQQKQRAVKRRTKVAITVFQIVVTEPQNSTRFVKIVSRDN